MQPKSNQTKSKQYNTKQSKPTKQKPKQIQYIIKKMKNKEKSRFVAGMMEALSEAWVLELQLNCKEYRITSIKELDAINDLIFLGNFIMLKKIQEKLNLN